MTAQFVASRSVRHAVVDGLRVVLDVRAERYRVLDDVATAFWAALTDAGDAAACLERLACEYEIEPEALRADLAWFAQRCVDEGLLAPAASALDPPPAAVRPWRGRGAGPPAARALSALVATHRALVRDGFRLTYERYAALPVRPRPHAVERALRAFEAAEHVFIVRRAPDDCLVRSLALFRFLRSLGVPAQHVIGVSRFPFGAHAWVEHDGAPVLGETVERFTPLARIGDAPPAGAR